VSELSSRLTSVRLPVDKLPLYAPHHAAKHKLIREYANVWLPKLGFSYPQTIVVDGYASAGRYQGNQQGSPLILLHAYLGRDDRDRFQAPPHFIFIEERKGFAQHLHAEVDALDLKGATVDVIHGSYVASFPRVVLWLADNYRRPLPTFVFVDPRGYKGNPFGHVQLLKRTLPEKSETMVYVPASWMARFAKTGITAGALDEFYSGRDWEEAVAAEETRRGASEALAGVFYDVMKSEFDWVTRFGVDPLHRNDYYLFFGTGNLHGLREMKRAMWKVDPVGGRAYEQSTARAVGQGELFPIEDVTVLPPEESLPFLLREHFGSEPFTIEQAEYYTLTETRYLDEGHLRKLALIPLQVAEHLQVTQSTRRRRIDFPKGTIMRFVS
jgi:three-Cys-motif partner protein